MGNRLWFELARGWISKGSRELSGVNCTHLKIGSEGLWIYPQNVNTTYVFCQYDMVFPEHPSRLPIGCNVLWNRSDIAKVFESQWKKIPSKRPDRYFYQLYLTLKGEERLKIISQCSLRYWEVETFGMKKKQQQPTDKKQNKTNKSLLLSDMVSLWHLQTHKLFIEVICSVTVSFSSPWCFVYYQICMRL